MLITYTGGLSAVTIPGGGYPSVSPGESVDVPEGIAWQMLTTGEWTAPDGQPEQPEVVTPARQTKD